jgi:hypothetical protein
VKLLKNTRKNRSLIRRQEYLKTNKNRLWQRYNSIPDGTHERFRKAVDHTRTCIQEDLNKAPHEIGFYSHGMRDFMEFVDAVVQEGLRQEQEERENEKTPV